MFVVILCLMYKIFNLKTFHALFETIDSIYQKAYHGKTFRFAKT